MKLSQVLSRTHPSDSASLNLRKHTPWITSPLDHDTEEDSQQMLGKGPHARELELDDEHQHEHSSQAPHFKHRHESSTVELFYDLFFVANLATFTSNHEITDTDSLKNYIGFFTLLWFTWLESSLFDVRFATNSIFNRVCKAVSFGVMTGFAVCGAIYDTKNIRENVKAFRAMSLLLMVSRLALAGQYAVVWLYVRKYKKTTAPLLSTIATLLLSSMGFLGTYFGFDFGNADSFPIQHDGPPTYIAWYVLVCVEALVVIIIACIWRVVSFKHTHLVERVGLLTLIIMGEGIIGMTKSVSQILQNSSTTSASDIGVLVAAVLLIYFIWVLYFDQIETERFGTIRQQIWAILHYPLHVGILLTVEGSTAFILWNIIAANIVQLGSFLYPDPSQVEYLTSTQDFVNWLNESFIDFSQRFKEGKLVAGYNYAVNLTSIEHIEQPFGSEDWNTEVSEITGEAYTGITNWIFENFGIEVEDIPLNASEDEKNDALFNVFDTVLGYFFIAAAAFLIVLAIMYWFGKTKKTKGEWTSIAVRVIAGIGIAMAYPGILFTDTSSINFLLDGWPIPTVTLAFFFVIVLDNLLVWHTNKTIARQTSNSREKSASESGSFGQENAGSTRNDIGTAV